MKLDVKPPLPDTALLPGRELYPWDTSDEVREVQGLLCAHGFEVAIDGDFGWKTEVAVKTYQRQHRLLVNGVVDRFTWISLKTTVQPGSRPLQEGDSGADVYELQGSLRLQGFAIKQDGVFGAETRSAVLSFQNQHHLLADGRVNRATWTILGEKSAEFQRRKNRFRGLF